MNCTVLSARVLLTGFLKYAKNKEFSFVNKGLLSVRIETNIRGFDLFFQTSKDCFSPNYIDKGTLAMLSLAEIGPGDKVLDLGCGYGAAGIAAAKICARAVMIDNDAEAVRLSRINAEANGVSNVTVLQSDGFSACGEKDFDLILCNPPYHTDFSVAKTFIEKGFNRLKMGGKMMMVTKRREWYKNKLISVFGGVKIDEAEGYYIFTAEKRCGSYAKKR